MAKRTRAPARQRRARKKSTPATAPKKPHGAWRRRFVCTPELLASGRHRYEHSAESVTDIAVDFGCHKSTLQRFADSQGWVRFVPPPRDLPRAVKLAAEAARLPPPERGRSPAEGGRVGLDADAGMTPTLTLPLAGGGNTTALPPDLPAVADTVVRMYRAALEELAAVETMRAQLKRQPHSPLDAERTARTLSSLQVVIERLQRQQAGLLNPEPEDDDDDFPIDIDEFRNELARRIDAFVASRTEPEDTNGEAVAARVAES